MAINEQLLEASYKHSFRQENNLWYILIAFFSSLPPFAPLSTPSHLKLAVKSIEEMRP